MSAVDNICKKYDFPFTPLPDQREKIDWHVSECINHVGMYWGMGSGKTFGSTLLNTIYREETGAQVIQTVPPILLRQWEKWLKRCGISVKIYSGTKKQRSKITLDRDTRYFVTTLGILKNDFDRIYDTFSSRKISVTVDEATDVKNFESGNFRAILQLSSGQAIMPMTGTPLATPRDAYAYIKLVSPGIYRSYTQFENIHVAQRDFFGTVTEWKNLELLRKNLAQRASFIDTREAHPDMPRATIDGVDYDLDAHHMKLYRALVDQQLVVFENGGAIDATTPNKLHHALQQIVLNYGYFAQQNDLVPAGFELLDEMMREIGRAKLVVFANYKMSVRSITEHLMRAGTQAVQVNGDISESVKDENIERFKNDPECQVIVMNPKSGGVGVDGLQDVCHHMLFMEIPTIAKDFWQGVKRLERPGQKYVTDVRIATALGTLQVHLRKKLVQNDGLVNTVVPSLNDLRAQLYGA